ITVEGVDWPPEVKEAIAAWMKRLLAEAVIEVARDGWKEVSQKLKIADEMEAKLLARAELDWPDGEEVVGSIYLIRPAKEVRNPECIVLKIDGKPFLRFTRAAAPVDRPVALVSSTAVVDGRPVQSEALLVYEKAGEWKQQRAGERTENLKP